MHDDVMPSDKNRRRCMVTSIVQHLTDSTSSFSLPVVLPELYPTQLVHGEKMVRKGASR